MTLEINFGLGESILFPCMKLFKTNCQLSNMVGPFEENKYNIKEIYLFGDFCRYKCLNCYRVCEPIYHIYRTALLYDFCNSFTANQYIERKRMGSYLLKAQFQMQFTGASICIFFVK